jgi:PKD domain
VSDEKKPSRIKGMFKVVVGSFLGLCTGAIMMYANAIFDKVVKPPKPVANFSVGEVEGLTVSLQSMASGQSGWWDFGDGSPLEAYEPEKPLVSHTYTKPGNYRVALSVRNFLNEENSRSISIDLAAPTASPNVLPPTIKGFKVEAISGTQAPATFKITGELENADEVIWRLGGKTEHLTAQAGPIEKYVQLDQPGQQHIVLTAFSKARKEPQVMVQTVEIQAQKQAVYTATLTVTDSTEKVEKIRRAETLALRVRDGNGAATTGFQRSVAAPPNCTIQTVELDKSAKAVIRRESLKVEIAQDRKTAVVSGTWSATGDALFREAGGSDVPLPLIVTEERVTRLSPRTSQMSGVLDAKQQIVIRTPPNPMPGVKRTSTVDFGLLMPDGKRTSVASGPLDAAGNWVGKAKLGGKDYTIQARSVGGQVIVAFQ